MMMRPLLTAPNSRSNASSQSANAYRPPPLSLARARPKLASESVSVESVAVKKKPPNVVAAASSR
jgi:hypothetical protein